MVGYFLNLLTQKGTMFGFFFRRIENLHDDLGNFKSTANSVELNDAGGIRARKSDSDAVNG